MGKKQVSILNALWKKCEEERIKEMNRCRDEAEKWKSENDMYGWNFWQGSASGMIQASLTYGRMSRAIPAIDAMADMLRILRTDSNSETINSILSDAGYSECHE